MKDVTYCCVFHCIIVFKAAFERKLTSFGCTLHKFIYIGAAYCDRKKSYCRKYRISSAYIIRYNKCLISFSIGKILKCSLSFVRSSINSLRCLIFTVFLLKHLLENSECDSRLCCSSGLGNYVNREIPVSDYIYKTCNICAADIVTYIIYFRCLSLALGNVIVETMSEEFYCRSGSEI